MHKINWFKKLLPPALGFLGGVLLLPISVVHATTVGIGSISASSFAELTGEAADDGAGYSVASTGDVNNDGYDDLLVGAWNNNDAASGAGAVYLVYGQSSVSSSGSLGASSILEFTGEAASDRAGISVASAGDVNNDGYDDMLIGADGNDDGGSGAGAAYLIYGQAGTGTGATGLGSSGIIEFTGETASDRAGYSVASAGDVNNDGYDDMLIGAFDYGATDTGVTYLIYGQASKLTSSSLDVLGIVAFTGEVASDEAGSSVASAGDVNNDGYDDLLVGASGNDDAASSAGAAYLMFGQASALTSQSLSAGGVVEFTGEAASDRAGISVAGAGDVNNDGYDDMLIGANGNDDAASGAGAAYLIYGEAGVTARSLGTSGIVEFTGEAAGDNAGYSVASTGDVNNDGYDDMLVGADYNDDAGSRAGAAYLMFGQASALSSQNLSTKLEFTGEVADDGAGYSVASAGDVNNNGYNDLLVGANGNDDAGSAAGAAYLVYAQPSSITLTNDTASVNTIECGTGTFTDPGATATDQYTNTSLTVSTTDTVTNATTGAQTVTYSTASNTLGIVGTTTRTVTVSDTVIPVLTLIGDSTVSVQQDSVYSDAGVTVTEACDTTLTATTTGSVDTATPGDYTLTYTATDASGNAASSVTRTVTVAPHGNITSISKSGNTVTITYADGYTQDIQPFSTGKFRAIISADNTRVIVYNGKKIKIYLAGVLVDQATTWKKKPTSRKYYRLRSKQFFSAKSYETIVFMAGKKTHGHIGIIRLTDSSTLTKKKTKTVDIIKTKPAKLTTKVNKKKFITRFSKRNTKTSFTWKVTKSGKLKRI